MKSIPNGLMTFFVLSLVSGFILAFGIVNSEVFLIAVGAATVQVNIAYGVALAHNMNLTRFFKALQ